MADSKVKYILEFIDKATSTLDRVISHFEALEKAMKKTVKPLKDTHNVVTTVTEKWKKMGNRIVKVGEQSKKIDTYTKRVKNASGGTDKFIKKIVTTEDKMKKTTKATNKLGKKIGACGVSMKKMVAAFIIGHIALGALKKIVSGVGGAFKWLGKTALGQTTEEGAEFAWQMHQIGIVAGEAGGDMDVLGKKILDAASTGMYGAEELQETYYSLAALGDYSADQLDEIVDAVKVLAVATGSDLSNSVETTAEVMNAFGLESSQVKDVVNILANTANRSALTVESVSTALAYVGSTARDAGLEVNEVSALLAILSNRGFDASKSGTYLREAIASLTAPSADASRQLRRMGVEVFDAEGGVKDFKVILEELGVATADMTDKRRLDTMQTIFGRRAGSAMAAILQSEAEAARLGKSSFADLATELEDGEQLLIDYAAACDTSKYKIETLNNAMHSLMLRFQMGITESEGFRGALDVLAGVFADTGLIESVEKIANAIGEMIGVVVGSEAFEKLVSNIMELLASDEVAEIITIVGETLIMLIDIVNAFMPAIKALLPVLATICGYIGDIIAVLMPLINIIAGGLTTVFEYLNESMDDGSTRMDKIMEAIVAITDVLVTLFIPVFKEMLPMILVVVDTLVAISPAIKTIAKLIKQLMPILNVLMKAQIIPLKVALRLFNIALSAAPEYIARLIDQFPILKKGIQVVAVALGIITNAVQKFVDKIMNAIDIVIKSSKPLQDLADLLHPPHCLTEAFQVATAGAEEFKESLEGLDSSVNTSMNYRFMPTAKKKDKTFEEWLSEQSYGRGSSTSNSNQYVTFNINGDVRDNALEDIKGALYEAMLLS